MDVLPVTARWRNWARTEQSHPALEIAPRSAEQVALAVRRARETGHTVKPIGASHSFSAIGATEGVRLAPGRLRGLVSADPARGRVTLGAGTRLWELPGILRPLGLALENMGDIDRQTIAGAISTGTHGTGLAFGGLATRVVGATLVTGAGEVLEVDEDHRPELLPAVALGLGALGVLVTVTIQCVPRYLLRSVEFPMRFDEALDRHVELHRESDHFEYFWFPHTRAVRVKSHTRLPFGAGAPRHSGVVRFVDEELMNNAALGAVVFLGRWVPQVTPAINRLVGVAGSRREYIDESHRVFVTPRRLRFREMEFALPLEAVPQAVRELRDLIDRRGFCVSFPIEIRSAAADDRWLSNCYGHETGFVAVHRYWRDPDSEYFREAEALLVAHGGRPHWGKMHTRTAEQLRGSYPRFDEFIALRDEFDPDRVFSNAYLDRVLGP